MSLFDLPDEIIDHIASFLASAELKELCLVSHRSRGHALCPLWRSVDLVDCQKKREIPEEVHEKWKDKHSRDNPVYGVDMHDDTPIIHKLFILASNPQIAERVEVLTHKCHVQTPALFSQELPSQSYHGATLSNDPTTWELLRLAIHNMKNVHTLRVVNGHYYLTAILLRGFFSVRREVEKPVRRLWLESCSVNSILFPSFSAEHKRRKFNMGGLESLRVRRVRMDNANSLWVHSRGGTMTNFHDGKGGLYPTTIYTGHSDCIAEPPLLNPAKEEPDFGFRYPFVDYYNAAIVDDLYRPGFSEIKQFLSSMPPLPDDLVYDEGMTQMSFFAEPTDGEPSIMPLGENLAPCPTYTLAEMIEAVSLTLTSLNIDWILLNNRDARNGYYFCERLSALRFRHLRAFQFRNTNSSNTKLPGLVYLFHPTFTPDPEAPNKRGWEIDFLQFMEAHPKLECLAWPMDRFYPNEQVEEAEAERARTVVIELGRSLTSLRVDCDYSYRRDRQTDERHEHDLKQERIRRRKFIGHFASQMTKLKTLKMEGSIPRDEKREVVRALHRCPLEKLVFIGLNYPIGNTWGEDGQDLQDVLDGPQMHIHGVLESEAEEAIAESTTITKLSKDPDFEFHAKYGWPAGPPLVQTIATFFADSITELKFCGQNGSPILHKPTVITFGLLYHLRHFHNLQTLISSFFLLTFFDLDWREAEIIKYWLDTQPGGTALLPVQDSPSEENPRPSDQEPNEVPGDQANANQPDDEQAMPAQESAIASFDGSGENDAQVTAIEIDNEAALDAVVPGQGGLDDTNDPNLSAPSVPTPEVKPWEVILRERFSPPAMAAAIHKLVGPHLSPRAKARTDANGKNVGVYVRASYCIGVDQEDIFDFDAWIGEKGPLRCWPVRSEGNPFRYWDKLERRLWF